MNSFKNIQEKADPRDALISSARSHLMKANSDVVKMVAAAKSSNGKKMAKAIISDINKVQGDLKRMSDELKKTIGEDLEEAKKLDPVGKADGDIDNDGDEDASDDYLKKRRAAIGKSMKEAKEKKLDPVGKADADIDNDGAVDDSDKFLKKRRAAIGKSMKEAVLAKLRK